MLAAKDNGLDTAVAVMLAAYPDLIRSHLEIPDDSVNCHRDSARFQ